MKLLSESGHSDCGAPVSEETEGVVSVPEGNGAGIDPLAATVALAGASRAEADAFLRDQRELIADQRRLVTLQAKELSHELDVRRWLLWVRHLSGLLKLTFEIGLAVAAVALAFFLGAAVWNASHADGLVIEPFSVPPDLASRGITGQVVASQMLDQLTIMQSSTSSARPERSYLNSWGDDLKVEIPETGVSLGEAYRFLRRWLGRETHVSGEVVRTATGIAITARANASSGTSFTGPESDLNALVVKSAEQIYRITQPDRYARYIVFYRPGVTPRFDEARAILNQTLRDASPAEKRYAWIGLGVVDRYQGRYRAAAFAYREAIAGNQPATVLATGLSVMEMEISHPETALSVSRTMEQSLERGSVDEIVPAFVDILRNINGYANAFLLGDLQQAAAAAREGVELALPSALTRREFYQDKVLDVLSLQHDGKGARAYRDSLPAPEGPLDIPQRAIARLKAEGALGHYQTVSASEPVVEKDAEMLGERFTFKDTFETQLRPLLALAKAKLGDIAGAQALIAGSPLDCYDCLRIRAQIAQAGGQPAQADDWFARAAASNPSIPFAYADWGQALLARGQPDAAIEKFKLSNAKGPHFADPLEGWGEALMAKNQSHLALARFAEAEKYAPNWGRLHLKWGEALSYAGRGDDAKVQFARAAQLDLTPSEKSELTRIRHV
jgi:tetratricopeptide (TPR) repeat protein